MANKTYAYLRASTAAQELSTAEQEKLCLEAHGRGKDMPPYGGAFVDEATSGAVPLHQRPDGRRLLLSIVKGDVILVAEFDRLGRNTVDIIQTVERFKEKGVRVHFLNCFGMELDTGTPVADLLLALMAAVATFERRNIKERMRRGREYKKSQNLRWGKIAAHGYKLAPNPDHRQGKPKYIQVPDTVEAAALEVCWQKKMAKHSTQSMMRYMRKHNVMTYSNPDYPDGLPFPLGRLHSFLKARQARYNVEQEEKRVMHKAWKVLAAQRREMQSQKTA